MKKIACMGTPSFTLGFALAGITTMIHPQDIMEDIHKLKSQKDIGIVIVEEALLDKLQPDERTEIEESVEPVFIALSTKQVSGNIRKLIIKSIGVDLWKEGEA